MGIVPMHLPATHAPRVTIVNPFPSKIELRASLPALALLLATSLLWMNLTWVTGLFELAFFLAAGIMAVTSKIHLTRTTPLLLACALPLWGAVGMLLGHAAYNYAALLATLHWTLLPACMLLGLLLFNTRSMRDGFLASLWLLAAAFTAIELYQVLMMGRFSFMSTGFPLMSSNLYAELAELLLPAVLATALRQGSRFWLGSILSALMLGTTVTAGARMGTILLLVEIFAVILLTRKSPGYRVLTWRKNGLALAVLMMAALALEGTNYLGSRIEQPNLFVGRTEVIASAVVMAQVHPAIGFGLGAFPVVYPGYAHLDTDDFVNHAHNDYLELAVDGGIPLLLLWLALIAASLPSIVQAPWSLGILAILTHSMTDFPLYRLPVLALLALLLAAAQTRAGEPRRRAESNRNHLSGRRELDRQAA